MELKIAKVRVCLDCGVDISHRGRAAKRCESCGDKHNSLRDALTNKAWKKANPERRQAIQARYLEKNSEKEKARKRKYSQANPNVILAASKRHYKANREKILPQMIIRRASNRDRISPSYAAELLKMPIAKCTPELIQMKREQILLHRLAKVLKQEIFNQLEK